MEDAEDLHLHSTRFVDDALIADLDLTDHPVVEFAHRMPDHRVFTKEFHPIKDALYRPSGV